MITLSPLKTERKSAPFNLLELLDELVGRRLRTGDILVASSKFIAISEGRVRSLNSVVPTGYAEELSSKFNMSPQLCELIIRESDEVLGGVIGFILASKDGLLSPNAGIDKSNIEPGKVVLYPRNSLESASAIVDAMEFRHGVRIGVVVSDSRLMPTRQRHDGCRARGRRPGGGRRPSGEGGPVREHPEGHKSGHSRRPLLSGPAGHGRIRRGDPLRPGRGVKDSLIGKAKYSASSFAVRADQCVYMRSLGYSARRTFPRAS